MALHPSFKFEPRTAYRFFGFLVAGVTGLFVELSAIYFLSEVLAWRPVQARCISLPSAIITTFFINRYFSKGRFQFNVNDSLGKYLCLMFLTSGLNFFIFLVLTILGIDKYVAVGLSTALISLVNFLLILRFF